MLNGAEVISSFPKILGWSSEREEEDWIRFGNLFSVLVIMFWHEFEPDSEQGE
jgi:hypothetical protein